MLEPSDAPGHKVNGELTLGENIGDLGGLSIGYVAYVLSLDGAEFPTVDGLTGPQRFFLAWARGWCTKAREAEAIRRLAIDPHSPPELRCNAVVRNIDEFYTAFDVKEGDAMWLAPGGPRPHLVDHVLRLSARRWRWLGGAQSPELAELLACRPVGLLSSPYAGSVRLEVLAARLRTSRATSGWSIVT